MRTLQLYRQDSTVPRWVLLWCMLLYMSTVVASEPSTNFKITYVAVNETNNTLELYCTTADQKWSETLADGGANFQLNIEEEGTLYPDVFIKKIEQISAYQYVLQIQPPLAASIYSIKQRNLELLYVHQDQIYSTKKTVLLGSSLRSFDLRPYTESSKATELLLVFYSMGILSILLWMMTPLAQKYRFKKRHIQKYIHEEEEHLDPFTFVTLQKGDDIVAVDDEMMLLSSWKTINKLGVEKLTEKHANFFKERQEGTFLKPNTKKFKIINKAWYGLIGISVGWLLHVEASDAIIPFLAEFLSLAADTASFQASSLLAREILLGFLIGLFYASALALCSVLGGKKPTQLQWVKSILLKTGIITLGFAVQALITSYVIPYYYVAIWVNWIILGITFASTAPKVDIKSALVIGTLAGLITASVYLMLSSSTVASFIGVSISLFLAILFLGGTITILKWRKETVAEDLKRIRSYVKTQFKKLIELKFFKKKISPSKQKTTSEHEDETEEKAVAPVRELEEVS